MSNPNTSPTPQEAMSPHDAMMQSLDATRQATRALGVTNVGGGYQRDTLSHGTVVEDMGVGYRGPHISTDKRRSQLIDRHGNKDRWDFRVDARTKTTSPGTSSEIHAYDATDNIIGDRGRVSIKRYDNDNNLVYEHKFKNRETAQKFVAKIGEHVTNRAQVAVEEHAAQKAA